MTWRALPRAAALGLAFLWIAGTGGCGGFSSDGGPVGTGRFSSIVGNVVDPAGDATTGVAVTLDEVPGLRSETDGDGNFALEGEFAGPLTLRFSTGQYAATQGLDVPSGAVIALSDVELSSDGVEVTAGRQLGFLGTVVEVDCAAGHAIVHDLRGATARFDVEFTEDTEFVDRDGAAAACSDLAPDVRVAIDSVFDPAEPEQATAVQVTVGSTAAPDAREPTRNVPFVGRVSAVNCERGVIWVMDRGGVTRVKLAADAKITRPRGQALVCSDIAIGNQVAGLGVLRLKQPGVLLARAVVVTLVPRPGLELLFSGRLGQIDCASGILQVIKSNRVTTVRLTPSTIVTPALTCEDLLLNERVSGRGGIDAADPQGIVATKLKLRRPASDSS